MHIVSKRISLPDQYLRYRFNRSEASVPKYPVIGRLWRCHISGRLGKAFKAWVFMRHEAWFFMRHEAWGMRHEAWGMRHEAWCMRRECSRHECSWGVSVQTLHLSSGHREQRLHVSCQKAKMTGAVTATFPGINLGLIRTVYIHHKWPYTWWFPCQRYRVYTVI